MTNSRFSKGTRHSGCFACECCGRLTRHAGQASSHLCPQCDEWTQIENGLMNDGYAEGQERADAEAAVARLKKSAASKGGDAERLGLTVAPV